MIPPEELIPIRPGLRTKPLKIKIEFSDESGTKYSINVEGSSKENVNRFIDLAQELSSKANQEEQTQAEATADTNYAKLYTLLQLRFAFGSFTSSDVLEAYQDDYQIRTSLSIISTYLSRLTQKGLLTRSRHGAGWIYKLPKIHSQTNIIHTQEQHILTNNIQP